MTCMQDLRVENEMLTMVDCKRSWHERSRESTLYSCLHCSLYPVMLFGHSKVDDVLQLIIEYLYLYVL